MRYRRSGTHLSRRSDSRARERCHRDANLLTPMTPGAPRCLTLHTRH